MYCTMTVHFTTAVREVYLTTVCQYDEVTVLHCGDVMAGKFGVASLFVQSQ